MTAYAERKKRILHELAVMQADMSAAEPGTFPWEARNRLLEKVEQLPVGEQDLWKRNHLEQLRMATEPLSQWRARQTFTQEGVSTTTGANTPS